MNSRQEGVNRFLVVKENVVVQLRTCQRDWIWLNISSAILSMSKLGNPTADPQDQVSYLPSPVQTPRLPTTTTSLCPLLIILNFLQKSQEPYLNFVQHIKFYNFFWKLIHYYFKLWTYLENSLKALYCSTALINVKKMLTFVHLGD